ncbi:MAG: hypothetical protein LBH52_02495 [Puniceicoccales bacterium]|jgi:hypothetical protein|nr:hypothetical protein [Puniceicoccales bacterium]
MSRLFKNLQDTQYEQSSFDRYHSYVYRTIPLKYSSRKRLGIFCWFVFFLICVLLSGYFLCSHYLPKTPSPTNAENTKHTISITTRPIELNAIHLQIQPLPATTSDVPRKVRTKIRTNNPSIPNPRRFSKSIEIAQSPQAIPSSKDPSTKTVGTSPHPTEILKNPSPWNLYKIEQIKTKLSQFFTYCQSVQPLVTQRLSTTLHALKTFTQYVAYRHSLEKFYRQGSWISLNAHPLETLTSLWYGFLNYTASIFEGTSKVIALAQQQILNGYLDTHLRPAQGVQSNVSIVSSLTSTSPLVKTNPHANEKVGSKDHRDSIYALLHQIKIYSVRIDGDASKVNLNGHVYYPHTFVSQSPKLKFVGIQQNELIFCDEYNQEFRKKISNN